KKKTRANIKLTTLNMKGHTSINLSQSPVSKWTTVNQTMRDQKIGILCLQETHLADEHLTQVEMLFSRQLAILNSSDPLWPGSSASIMFVMNKELTNTTNATMEVLIPGRVAVLKLDWHNDETIRILNIYVPNNANKHRTFWDTIKSEWERKNIGALDFMMGDFNLTKNPIDHAPVRLDNETVIEALRDLKSILNMHDEWRNKKPHQRMFTFNSNHQSLSRLDRIYISERHTASMLDWNSNVSQIPTDHHIVSVRFAPPYLPHIGRGRWSWPVGLMMDKDLIKRIINIGMDAQREIDGIEHRSNTANPQQIWKLFKNKITSAAKETSKQHLARINQLDHAIASWKDQSQKTITQVHNTWTDIININKHNTNTNKDWVTTLEVLEPVRQQDVGRHLANCQVRSCQLDFCRRAERE
ncbi:Endonuclease/exonuclease/phosphatase, partial [Suillus variegatus]